MTWCHANAGAGWWCRLSEHVGIIMPGCNSGVGGLYIYFKVLDLTRHVMHTWETGYARIVQGMASVDIKYVM